jgi:hypothetical protein
MVSPCLKTIKYLKRIILFGVQATVLVFGSVACPWKRKKKPFHERGVVAKEPGLYFVSHISLCHASDTVTGMRKGCQIYREKILDS